MMKSLKLQIYSVLDDPLSAKHFVGNTKRILGVPHKRFCVDLVFRYKANDALRSYHQERLSVSLLDILYICKSLTTLSSVLGFNVFSDCLRRYIASSTNIIAMCPKRRQSAFKLWKFFSQRMTGIAFNAVHNLFRRKVWWKRSKQVNVIWSNNQFNIFTTKYIYLLWYKFNQTVTNFINQNRSSIFGTPNKVIINLIN